MRSRLLLLWPMGERRDCMELTLYQATRERMLADPKWRADFCWAESVFRPESQDVMARELIWIIANSGMKNTVARGNFNRVIGAMAYKVPTIVDGELILSPEKGTPCQAA